MNRINAVFAACSQSGRTGLIAFCTAGYPDQHGFAQFLTQAPQAGVDLIEVGMPFSDPIADGPTIQLSNRASLKARTNLQQIFTTLTQWRATNTTTPVVLMGYYNPVLQYGEARFIRDCASSGVDGLILVDLPPEESSSFDQLAQQHGVAVIRLITPTTSADRMQQICNDRHDGFAYYVAVTGITGVKKGKAEAVRSQLASLRDATNLPIAVGFGIATPEDAARMAGLGGDAIVVGSAVIRAIQAGGVSAGIAFLRDLRKALDG